MEENKKTTTTKVVTKPKTVDAKETLTEKSSSEQFIEKSKYDELLEQVNNLQSMFIKMQGQTKPASVSEGDLPATHRVPIISYMLRPVRIPVNKNGKELLLKNYLFVGYLSVREVDDVLANPNVRDAFETGLIGFTDKLYYTYFGVSCDKMLNDENILEMLNLEDDKMQEEINLITNNLQNSSIVHHLVYKIAWLIKNNKASGVSASKVALLDKIFFSSLPKNWSMSLSRAQEYLDFM